MQCNGCFDFVLFQLFFITIGMLIEKITTIVDGDVMARCTVTVVVVRWKCSRRSNRGEEERTKTQKKQLKCREHKVASVLVKKVPASKNLPSVTRSFDREISNDFAKRWLGPAWELPSNLVRHEWMALSGPSLFNLFFGQLKHPEFV